MSRQIVWLILCVTWGHWNQDTLGETLQSFHFYLGNIWTDELRLISVEDEAELTCFWWGQWLDESVTVTNGHLFFFRQ